MKETYKGQMLNKLKRAVIKEEFVVLTGSVVRAVILNQLIYWAERVRDFDDFKKQENEAARNNGCKEQELSAGWFYKTAEELSEETMLGISKSTMRAHLKSFIDEGFLCERINPAHKWDKTKQYRVNLCAINNALKGIGYSLEGYFETEENDVESEVLKSNTEVLKSNTEVLKPNIEVLSAELQYQRLQQRLLQRLLQRLRGSRTAAKRKALCLKILQKAIKNCFRL